MQPALGTFLNSFSSVGDILNLTADLNSSKNSAFTKYKLDGSMTSISCSFRQLKLISSRQSLCWRDLQDRLVFISIYKVCGETDKPSEIWGSPLQYRVFISFTLNNFLRKFIAIMKDQIKFSPFTNVAFGDQSFWALALDYRKTAVLKGLK